MRVKVLQTIPGRILSWLTVISTSFVCHRFQEKNFIMLDAWRGYCPDLTGATLTLPVKSIMECAFECSGPTSQCFAFGFYSSSETCSMYSFVPKNVYSNDDCTLMMVRYRSDIGMLQRKCKFQNYR